MTEDMHPDVAAVLHQAQKLQAIMDERTNRGLQTALVVPIAAKDWPTRA